MLIGPCLAFFRTVKADLRLNLILTAVIVYSALLAIYYLFVRRETRFSG